MHRTRELCFSAQVPHANNTQELARTRTSSSANVNANALTYQSVWHCQLSVMSSKSYIAKLARALKTDLPNTLQKILVESSFDCEASILGINTEIIKEVESFVNQNKHILENTEYEAVLKNNSIFKFKPGHKSVLNLLPQRLRDYKSNKKSDKKKDGLTQQQEEEQLKDELIEKLSNFSGKNSLGISFEKSSISNYRIEKNKPKCKILCPLCNIQYTCYYTTFWNRSNFEKHLKKHFVEIEVSEEHENQLSNQNVFSYVNDDDLNEVSD